MEYTFTLPAKRYERYRHLSENYEVPVDTLYLVNTKLSESMYLPLQTLEITLRNSIHSILAHDLGPYWFDLPDILKVPNQYEQIGDAKSSLLKDNKPIEPDRLVAQLMMGFWVNLFITNYEELWRQHLHKIILPDQRKGIQRQTLSGNLNPLRKLRNRIAHHECILEWDMYNYHQKIIILLGYLSSDAKSWVKQNSSFPETYENYKKIIRAVHQT